MKSSTLDARRFVARLGAHHFAHLRATAEGLDVVLSAKRYLGVNHGHEARAAHQQTVEAVRAIARRRGDRDWRLIGALVRSKATSEKPSLEAFIEERGLDGWSEAEVAEFYEEIYPSDPRAARRDRLRLRQLELIRTLAVQAAEQPEPTDRVSGWFDDITASRLTAAGMVTLADLAARIQVGGRWYSALPSVGRAKALRIEATLARLLPGSALVHKPQFGLSPSPALFDLNAAPNSRSTSEASSGLLAGLSNNSSSSLALAHADQKQGLLSARNDQEAIDAWIAARAGSEATAKTYRREAHRLLLWLRYERGGKGFGALSVNDCGDYMAFLQHVPARWISRVRAAPGQPGWAPFRGPLSHQSRRQAIVIVASMFKWLQAAQYIAADPWLLINQKTGDEEGGRLLLDTKAFSEEAFAAVLGFVDAQVPSPSRARIRFILVFLESVGLRSTELVRARVGELRREENTWLLQVHGKGAKNRLVVVPGRAVAALESYLFARGLGNIRSAPPEAPLLASTRDPMEPIGYQALYEHVKGWVSKSLAGSSLDINERMKLNGATTHWLRHTFGTRAVAREVPLDVIQAQLGHASIQTTMSIYGRAPIRRRAEEVGKAFD